jgi:hypothetical protein
MCGKYVKVRSGGVSERCCFDKNSCDPKFPAGNKYQWKTPVTKIIPLFSCRTVAIEKNQPIFLCRISARKKNQLIFLCRTVARKKNQLIFLCRTVTRKKNQLIFLYRTVAKEKIQYGYLVDSFKTAHNKKNYTALGCSLVFFRLSYPAPHFIRGCQRVTPAAFYVHAELCTTPTGVAF